MSIYFEDIVRTRMISVLSLSDAEKELEILRDLLGEKSFDKGEIYFYDIDILPVEAVELIENYTSCEKFKVFVQKKCLNDYLSRLGIHSTLLDNNLKKRHKNIRAIVLGGSTDSLHKILEIASKIALANIPVFIVQHVRQDSKNLMADLMNNRTKYSVISPADNTPVEPGNIYVAPSAYHMVIKNGHIHLYEEQPVNYARPSIDVLFDSLAAEYGNDLLAVLLCGYGNDGVKALAEIKKAGGKVIIADPSECVAKSLILNALKQDKYSVMSVQNIIEYINMNLIPKITLQDALILFENIYDCYGYDFRNYQPDSILRRLNKIAQNSSTIDDIIKNIIKNENFFNEFLYGLTIKTTEFFRDGQVFEILRSKIFPYLNSFNSIKIWCAGCSTGEEAYSLAILLDEAGMLGKSRIYATDLSFNNIQEAKNGLFSAKEVEEANQNYLDSGGKGSLSGYFLSKGTYSEIKPKYKERIFFLQHSLVESGVLNEFQLILCRNVIMYFNNDLQEKTLKLLYESVDISGFVILGKSEGLFSNDGSVYFKDYDSKNKIYKKKIFD